MSEEDFKLEIHAVPMRASDEWEGENSRECTQFSIFRLTFQWKIMFAYLFSSNQLDSLSLSDERLHTTAQSTGSTINLTVRVHTFDFES